MLNFLEQFFIIKHKRSLIMVSLMESKFFFFIFGKKRNHFKFSIYFFLNCIKLYVFSLKLGEGHEVCVEKNRLKDPLKRGSLSLIFKSSRLHHASATTEQNVYSLCYNHTEYIRDYDVVGIHYTSLFIISRKLFMG